MDTGVVQAVNQLTSRWVRAVPPGNTVVSGLGLWPLLAILATAADEPGRSELAAATGVPPDSSADRALALVRTIEAADDLHAALGLWVHERLKLSETFDSVIPAQFTGLLTGDMDRDKAALDAWAAEHTNGLIKRMPIEVRPALAVVLASALSLRTTWVRPFTEQIRNLNDGPWAGASWHWLNRSDPDLDTLRLYDDPGASPLSVITVAGDADVDVLLAIGDPGAGRSDVLAGLVAAATHPDNGRPGSELILGGQPSDLVAPAVRIGKTTLPTPVVQLSVPAFAVEVEHDLLQHAELFGLSAVSKAPGETGHFSAISPEPLQLDQAKQKVLARFFATGFEAAAVTAVGMMRASMPIEQERRLDVDLDRPFAFIAVHRASRLPVVAGWIDQPTEPG